MYVIPRRILLLQDAVSAVGIDEYSPVYIFMVETVSFRDVVLVAVPEK